MTLNTSKSSNNFTKYFAYFVFVSISLFVTTLIITKVSQSLSHHSKNVLAVNDNDRNITASQHNIVTKLVDQTFEYGITHLHSQRNKTISDIKDTLGAGLCQGDVDGDFIPDILFTTGSGTTRFYGKNIWWKKHQSINLYLNKNGRFVNKTLEFGLSSQFPSMACSLADLDNDGDNDLVITSVKGIHLFQNIKNTEFKEVAQFVGKQNDQWSTGISVIDINNDELLDLYITQYVKYNENQKLLEFQSGFSGGLDAAYSPENFDGTENVLLINSGELTFEDKSKEYRLNRNSDRSIGALWFDFNRDNQQDLFILNDSGSPSRLLLSKRTEDSHYFEESADQYNKLRTSHAKHALLLSNNLLVNRKNGFGSQFFELNQQETNDVSWDIGLNTPMNVFHHRWGSSAGDFNMDGHLDLFLSSGLRKPDNYSKLNTLGQKNSLYLGRDDGSYVHQETFYTPLRHPAASRSSVTMDVNLDGKQDIVVSNNNAYPQLLINHTPSEINWINIQFPSSGFFESANIHLKQNDFEKREALSFTQHYLGSSRLPIYSLLPNKEKVEVTIVKHGLVKKKLLLTPNQNYYITPHFDAKVLPPNTPTLSSEQEQIKQHPELLSRFYVKALEKKSGPLSASEFELLQSLLSNETLRPQLFGPSSTASYSLLPIYMSMLEKGYLTDKAFDALAKLESDISVLYLLPYLAIDSPYACEVSALFETWYREEEAALKNKDLAIPALIKLLKHERSNIVECAAKALAEAEHQTSSSPLEKAFMYSKNIKAKKSILSAIGSVRQTSSEPFLVKVIKASSDATIIAEALTAYSRIHFENAGKIGDSLFIDKSAESRLLTETLGLLLSDDLRPAVTTARIERWAKPYQNLFTSSHLNTLSEKAALNIASHFDISISNKKIETALQSKDRDVQQLALKTPKWNTMTKPAMLLSANHQELFHQHVKRLSGIYSRRDFFEYYTKNQRSQEFLAMSLKYISLYDRGAASAIIESAQRTNFFEGIDIPSMCKTTPQSNSPSARSVQIQPQQSGPLAIFVAAITTKQHIAEASIAQTKKWLEAIQEMSSDNGQAYFQCLANLNLPIKIEEKISLSIFSNPTLNDRFKEQRLITARHSDRYLQAARQKKLEYGDKSFVIRFVNAQTLPLANAMLNAIKNRAELEEPLNTLLKLHSHFETSMASAP